eukprot:scaffold7207_cov105-Skeletonema_dohrnii-CCMP3373.AAC.2
MGSSPKRNLRSIGPMPPPPWGHIAQIWSSLAFVERVWRKSSLVIVLPVTVLFPIVVNFLFSAVWRHRSALVHVSCPNLSPILYRTFRHLSESLGGLSTSLCINAETPL